MVNCILGRGACPETSNKVFFKKFILVVIYTYTLGRKLWGMVGI